MKKYSKIIFPFPYLYRPPEHISKDYEFNYLALVPEGWQSLLSSLLDKIESLEDVEVSVLQIKEKFGGLRFYYQGSGEDFPKVRSLAQEAETLSTKTCVVCGNPGIMRHAGWISPYCDEHYKQNDGEDVDVY